MEFPYSYESNILAFGKPFFSEQMLDIANLFRISMKTERNDLQAVSDLIKNGAIDRLIIIGMGGAVNTSSALLGLMDRSKLKIIVIDAPDHELNEEHFDLTKLQKTACLVISKSGATPETLVIAQHWIALFEKENLPITSHFYFILGSDINSPISQIAVKKKCTILRHTDLSGRFAIFSNITCIPSLLAGAHIERFLQGGADILDDFQNNKENSLALQTAAEMISVVDCGFSNHVLISYSAKLDNFFTWQSQIIAESLGKNGFGITPIKNSGPESQHSQFELYLSGVRDKFFSFFTLEAKGKKSDLKQLVYMQSDVAYRIFQKKMLPIRKFIIKELDEYTMGALCMHVMLENAIIGLSYGLPIFTQPLVESIKSELGVKLAKSKEKRASLT